MELQSETVLDNGQPEDVGSQNLLKLPYRSIELKVQSANYQRIARPDQVMERDIAQDSIFAYQIAPGQSVKGVVTPDGLKNTDLLTFKAAVPVAITNSRTLRSAGGLNQSTITFGLIAGAFNHTILDANFHTDSLAHAVVRGDLIVGNATPKWASLAAGVAGTFLRSNGTDPSWQLLTLGDIPAGIPTGSGAVNRVAYWSSATALTSSPNLTYNGTLLKLLIPAGVNQALSVTGYSQFNDRGDNFGTQIILQSGTNPEWHFYSVQGTGNFRIFHNKDFAGTVLARDVIVCTNADGVNIGSATDAVAYGALAFGLTGAQRAWYDVANASLKLYDAGGTLRFTFDPRLTVAGTTHFLLTAAAHSGVTGEVNDAYVNLARTITWNIAGPQVNQRSFLIDRPTHSSATLGFVITNPATFAIVGPPIAAGTTSFTNGPYSLWVQSGLSRFDGSLSFLDATYDIGSSGNRPREIWSSLSVEANAGQSVSNSTVLVDSTALTVNVQAGGRYRFKAFVFWTTASITAGIKFSMKGTCTATDFKCQIGIENDSGSSTGFVNDQRISSLGNSVGIPGSGLITGNGYATLEGDISVNAAGTLLVQFAQQVADANAANAAKLESRSYMVVDRIA